MSAQPHPLLMAAAATACFLLAFIAGPWFFALMLVFLMVWAWGFMTWLFR